MTERELKGLKDLPVPAPRETAKAAAVRAALDAFDDAGKNSLSAPKESRAAAVEIIRIPTNLGDV